MAVGKLENLISAQSAGLLGKKIELLGVSIGCLNHLKMVGKALGLDIHLIPCKPLRTNNCLIGVASVLDDSVWLTERGKLLSESKINELLVDARLTALKGIKNLSPNILFRGDLKGLTTLVILDEKTEIDEVLGSIELLKLKGASRILPLGSNFTPEQVKLISSRCETFIELTDS